MVIDRGQDNFVAEQVPAHGLQPAEIPLIEDHRQIAGRQPRLIPLRVIYLKPAVGIKELVDGGHIGTIEDAALPAQGFQMFTEGQLRANAVAVGSFVRGQQNTAGSLNGPVEGPPCRLHIGGLRRRMIAGGSHRIAGDWCHNYCILQKDSPIVNGCRGVLQYALT
ncbi:hypothetical protein ES703_71077 [subsurface metagenome]